MRNVIAYTILSVLIAIGSRVEAAEYSVRPFLIDLELEPRSIETELVTLHNDSPNRKYIVFATVNEISLDESGEIKEFVSPVMTDRSNTVTSWIEVKRSRIEVPPQESVEVPITFRVNPDAIPGEYQAFVGFVPAPNRPIAERAALDGTADGVVVKITIADQRKDSMKIGSFSIDRFVTDEDSKHVNINVENLGELPSSPVGEIIFYDSRGREVAAAPINSDGKIVSPGETSDLSVPIPFDDQFGKFKANVRLEYGANQRASLQDTTFFFYIPQVYFIYFAVGVIAISLILTLLFRRVFLAREFDEDAEAVTVFVAKGHSADPKDHDIDLKNK